ncbi:hypothetical protein [Kingella kingae]|uniref:hypothetical protein n=1 Tax=Kingella kingae TaxID=504 RepID=UPI001E542F32|nr:hypothetical protein [Kingella kingae]
MFCWLLASRCRLLAQPFGCILYTLAGGISSSFCLLPIALSTLAQPKPFFITGMALSQNLLLWLVLWQTIVSHEPAVLLHIIGMLGWSIGWLIGLLRQKLYRSHRSAFWNGLGMPLLGVFLLLLLIGLGV